jgi:predicted Rossmann fold flavoprotein
MKPTHYDVLVIGAGPAGMIAAGQASLAGAQTLLVEKMDRAGRKLQLTGKGRCNLTNTASLEEFISHFGSKGRFLHSSFAQFFNQDLLDFIHSLGVETIEERGGRIFPRSQDALQIVHALVDWLERSSVHVLTSTRAQVIQINKGQVTGLDTRENGQSINQDNAETIPARAIIIATGGASYPGTGSTGDGYRLAEAVGHRIIPIRPALVPLVTSGETAAQLQGLSLKNVRVNLVVGDKTVKSEFGEMLFTHFGLSGPIILTISGRAVEALEHQEQVIASIDLKPALDPEKLDARLLRDLDAHGKKTFRSILKGLLPTKLIPVCLTQLGIAAEKPAHQVSSEERQRLATFLKDFRLEVTGHRSFRQAVITAGGIDLKQIDPRTLASKLIPGLFFAGEVLDLDADTGGYNLQAAFSTGWVAGRAAAAYASEKSQSP